MFEHYVLLLKFDTLRNSYMMCRMAGCLYNYKRRYSGWWPGLEGSNTIISNLKTYVKTPWLWQSIISWEYYFAIFSTCWGWERALVSFLWREMIWTHGLIISFLLGLRSRGLFAYFKLTLMESLWCISQNFCEYIRENI